MAQDLVTQYIKVDIAGFNQSVPIVILIVSLLVLARDRTRRGGSTADEAPPPEHVSLLPKWRRAAPWVAATIVFIIYVEFLANVFWSGVMAQGLALSLIFLSFVVVTGMGGMVSLAEAAFSTAAGLTTGLLIQHYHVPLLLAVLAALAITGVIGTLVALPALRLGGLFLALATLALALLGDSVLFPWNYLDNSTTGWTIPRFVIGPLNLASNRTMAMVLLFIVFVIIALITNLRRSLWGRSIAAVRSSEIAAASSGVAPLRVKLTLFAISAVIAGLGGIFYGSFQTSYSAVTTPAFDGLLWLATVVLFGIRRPGAAVLAGIVSAASGPFLSSGFHWWSWVPSWLSWNGTQSTEIPLILFGLGAVGLSRDPDGFISHAAAQNHMRRLRRAAKRQGLSEPDVLSPVPLTPTLRRVITTENALITEETRRHGAELIASDAVRAPGDGSLNGGVRDVLSLRSVHVAYGSVEVLHGIDLSLAAGQILSLLGVNGSGKSTLCSAISRPNPTDLRQRHVRR